MGAIAADSTETWGARVLRNPLANVLVAIGTTVLITALTLVILGFSPISVASAIIKGSLGSPFAIGQTLAVAAPLILLALAAAVPFSARLWNIGGEGQMAVGGVACVLVALLVDGITGTALLVLSLIAGIIAGALCGLIPGVLKSRFGVNEVIVTIMMNFIALLLVGIVVSGSLRSYAAQTIAIPADAHLPAFPSLPGANWGIILAVVGALLVALLLSRTRLGFEIRAVGLNHVAAAWAGMNPARVTMLSFVIGGALAGLAGAIEVTGKNFALVQGFTANLGFLGIVAALVARLKPVGILAAGMFFAIVTVGGNNLRAAVGIDKALSVFLVGLFVLVLLITGALSYSGSSKR